MAKQLCDPITAATAADAVSNHLDVVLCPELPGGLLIAEEHFEDLGRRLGRRLRRLLRGRELQWRGDERWLPCEAGRWHV